MVPNGVVSLLSALRYHGLTTQLPHAVWMTIPHKARTPKTDSLSLEIVRATGEVLIAGVEYARIEGVDVPIYGVAETVADCFKHRNKIGLDVALEALKDARAKKKVSADDLWRFAKICRVANVMRPYLEAVA